MRVTVPLQPAAAAAATTDAADSPDHSAVQDNTANYSSSSSSNSQLISIWNAQLPLASQSHRSSGSSSRGSKVSGLKAMTRADQLEMVYQLVMTDYRAVDDESDSDSCGVTDNEDDDPGDRPSRRSATDNAQPYRAAASSQTAFCVIAGDLKAAKQHDRDMGPFTLDNGWTDAWPAVQKQQHASAEAQERTLSTTGKNNSSNNSSSSNSSNSSSGCTYCPSENHLAKQLSSSGMSARYDRVLMFGKQLQV